MPTNHKRHNTASRGSANELATPPEHPVTTALGPVGRGPGLEREVEGLKTYASVLDVPGAIDMASFYVPPEVGEKVIVEVARKGITEVWLNPGSESDALIRLARSLKIEPIEACSIVGIGENPYV